LVFIQVGPRKYYSENMLLVLHCRQYVIMYSMSSSSNWAPNENKRDAWKDLTKGSSYAMREKLAGQKLRWVFKPFSSPSLCPKQQLSLQPVGYSEATNSMLFSPCFFICAEELEALSALSRERRIARSNSSSSRSFGDAHGDARARE